MKVFYLPVEQKTLERAYLKFLVRCIDCIECQEHPSLRKLVLGHGKVLVDADIHPFAWISDLVKEFRWW